jgi:hypothetical protein
MPDEQTEGHVFGCEMDAGGLDQIRVAHYNGRARRLEVRCVRCRGVLAWIVNESLVMEGNLAAFAEKVSMPVAALALALRGLD